MNTACRSPSGADRPAVGQADVAHDGQRDEGGHDAGSCGPRSESPAASLMQPHHHPELEPDEQHHRNGELPELEVLLDDLLEDLREESLEREVQRHHARRGRSDDHRHHREVAEDDVTHHLLSGALPPDRCADQDHGHAEGVEKVLVLLAELQTAEFHGMTPVRVVKTKLKVLLYPYVYNIAYLCVFVKLKSIGK